MGCFLGIDTSNYTTSVSLVRDGRVEKNIKKPVGVVHGQKGIRQSEAVFAHIKNLPLVMEELGNCKEIEAIGYSARPGNREGSYMPCFLSGEAVARSLSAVLGVPSYAFSHQEGHIMAAIYSANKPELLNNPFIAFHVSGGTTDVLIVSPKTPDHIEQFNEMSMINDTLPPFYPKETKAPFTILKIGGTLDLNAGQAIDRIGVMLGFNFPCGPEIEKAAEKYYLNQKEHKFYIKPSIKPNKDGTLCNFSGLENLAIQMREKGASTEEISAFALEFVLCTLDKLCENAQKNHGKMPVLFSGGVMSNKIIRKRLESKYEAYFATPEFSADNAAGIALLCEAAHNYA